MLSQPLGGLNIYKDKPFLMIYQVEDYYEVLMYYYNGEEYSIIDNVPDKNKPRVTDIIYLAGETAKIQSIKKDEVKIQYDNGAKSEIDIKDCIKYDMSIIYKLLSEFINNCKSKSINNKKEIITFEDIDLIMRDKLDFIPIEGYYDNYHKLVCKL